MSYPPLGTLIKLPPTHYCLSDDYEAAHPGDTRYDGGPCSECVPTGVFDAIRRFLSGDPENVEEMYTLFPGVSQETYLKVLRYLQAH